MKEKEVVKNKPDTKGTGGNSNAWSARYREMLMKFKVMNEMGIDENILKGYKMALDVFESKPSTKKKSRLK